MQQLFLSHKPYISQVSSEQLDLQTLILFWYLYPNIFLCLFLLILALHVLRVLRHQHGRDTLR